MNCFWGSLAPQPNALVSLISSVRGFLLDEGPRVMSIRDSERVDEAHGEADELGRAIAMSLEVDADDA